MNRSRVRFHLSGVDVADADEVAHQQGDRGAAAPARRSLLQRRLRISQTLLLHDGLGKQHDLPVEEEEPREPVHAYQPELLFKTLPDPRGHGPVAPLGRLQAEPSQEAVGRVSLRHLGVRQRIAEVGTEIEGALLRDAARAGYGIGTLPEEPLHLGGRLQMQVVVGPDEGERPVDGGIPPRGHERVL